MCESWSMKRRLAAGNARGGASAAGVVVVDEDEVDGGGVRLMNVRKLLMFHFAGGVFAK